MVGEWFRPDCLQDVKLSCGAAALHACRSTVLPSHQPVRTCCTRTGLYFCMQGVSYVDMWCCLLCCTLCDGPGGSGAVCGWQIYRHCSLTAVCVCRAACFTHCDSVCWQGIAELEAQSCVCQQHMVCWSARRPGALWFRTGYAAVDAGSSGVC